MALATIANPRGIRPEHTAIAAACGGPRGFLAFLPHYQFLNREGSGPLSFAGLWRGQGMLADAMVEHDWLFALKAGKLGFSEMACAFDVYRLRWGAPNTRVHLFSQGQRESRELLSWVRYGLDHLPEWMRLPIIEGKAGADNSTSIMLDAGPDDVRTVVSYPAGENISINQTCNHAHLDEFSRWPHFDSMWAAVQSTISPLGGTCHIITRGNGPGPSATVWRKAKKGEIVSQSGQRMKAFFAPYYLRTGRGGSSAEARNNWIEGQRGTYSTKMAIGQWAPETEADALQGDESYVYPQFENPPGRHVFHADPCLVGECGRIAIGIDLGMANPTAMGLWGERSSGRRHLYDEFYQPNTSTDEVEDQIIAWWNASGQPRDGRMRVAVPNDEKLLRNTLENHLAPYGIIVLDAIRDPKSGVQEVSRYLNDNALTVNARCVNHINEFEDYRNTITTDSHTKIQYAGDRPIKHHADAMEAMRYAHLLLATWVEYAPVTLRSGRRIMGVRG